MQVEKISRFFADARTVFGGVLALLAVAAWAGDTRYLTIAAADTRDVQQIRREIAELEVRKGYAKGQDKQMFDTLIRVKENQIKSIKGE